MQKNVRKVFFVRSFFDLTFYIFTFSPDTGSATLPEGSGLVWCDFGWFGVHSEAKVPPSVILFGESELAENL